jgi:hypothetical protein
MHNNNRLARAPTINVRLKPHPAPYLTALAIQQNPMPRNRLKLNRNPIAARPKFPRPNLKLLAIQLHKPPRRRGRQSFEFRQHRNL